MGTRMTKVTPKKPMPKGKLDFINQLIYIQHPTREHQIITSKIDGPDHIVPDQQKITPNTLSPRKYTTLLEKTQQITRKDLLPTKPSKILSQTLNATPQVTKRWLIVFTSTPQNAQNEASWSLNTLRLKRFILVWILSRRICQEKIRTLHEA